MPTVKMINFNGEEVGEFSLTDAVFGAPIHVPLGGAAVWPPTGSNP